MHGGPDLKTIMTMLLLIVHNYTDMIIVIISKAIKLERNITIDTMVKNDLIQYELYAKDCTTP